MHLKYQFQTMFLMDRVIAVPVGENSENTKSVIRLNSTAAAIFDLLKEETSEEQIVESLMTRYDVSKETLEHDVHMYIEEFRKRNLIV